MSKVKIELDLLYEWQRKLEGIDGTLSITEQMYDIIQEAENELRASEDSRSNFLKEFREKEAGKLGMHDIITGNEYRISLNASFKDKYAALKGAIVRVRAKKRTNIDATIVSDVSGFTGRSFLMKPHDLERL